MLRQLNHKLNALIRKLKLSLTDKLISPFSKYNEAAQAEANLILRLDGKIGDAVTSTGFLKQIKQYYPQQKLILVVNGSQAAVFKNLSYIDEIITIDKSFKQLIKVIKRLRKTKFKYIINTSHILKPNVVLLAGLLQAAQKLTFDNPNIKTFSRHIQIDFTKDHITDRYKKTLVAMEISTPGDLSYELKLNLEDVQKAMQKIKNLNAEKVIALNSFAGARDRNLGLEKTLEIVKRLTKNPGVYVLCLAGADDGKTIRQWMSEYPQPQWVYFSEFKSLEENSALLSQCQALITPDTAWVHIASALKVKLLAIFREDTNLQELNTVIWAPFGYEHRKIIVPYNIRRGSKIENVNIEHLFLEFNRLLQDDP